MPTGFPQQDTTFGICFPKQVQTPQHGQKAPPRPPAARPPRSYLPRPGH
jgi:hypothetical protein